MTSTPLSLDSEPRVRGPSPSVALVEIEALAQVPRS